MVTPAGIISTFIKDLPAIPLQAPVGVAVDSNGNVYVSDFISSVVWRGTPGGSFSVFAGTGVAGFGGDGVQATDSTLIGPYGLAIDGHGNLYIAENGTHRIRLVDTQGIIHTFAGTGTQGFSGDGGLATNANLDSPFGIAVDATGNVFIADTRNNRLRQVAPNGIITTVAGSGAVNTVLPSAGDGGLASAALLNNPLSVTVSSTGDIYVSDGTARLWRFRPGGVITAIGTGACDLFGDGGPASAAPLCVFGLTADTTGNVYVSGHTQVRRIDPSGNLSTVAGTDVPGAGGDGGPATQAQLNSPGALAVGNTSGDLYIADQGNVRVRHVTGGNRCTVTLDDFARAIGAGPFGGSLDVSSAPSCDYTATTNAPWVHLNSGAQGNAGGTVQHSEDANLGTTERNGSIVVSVPGATATYYIDQAAPTCQFALNPTTVNVSAIAQSGFVQVVQTPVSCASWTLSSDSSWLVPTGAVLSGNLTGNSYLAYNNNTGQSRTGTLTFGNQISTVIQAPSSVLIVSPAPNSTISGRATFSWTTSSAANFEYRLGTSPGAMDIADGLTTSGSVTIGKLPATGTVYFSLLYSTGGVWQPIPIAAAYTLAPPTPAAVSVTPSSGSLASPTFALQYSDSAGAANLQTVYVYFNATLASSASNSCFLYYNIAANQINLLNDSGAAWMTATPGAGTTLQNSQCSLNVATSSVTLNGNTLTLNLAMTFKPTFAGAKNIYMYAADFSGPNSGWQQLGTWTVPGGSITVTANSVTPSLGSVASQMFALQYSDTAGAANLQTMYAYFNATLASSASNSCFLYYNVAANQINLLNDAGAAWMTATLGAAATLQNSQCSLNVAATSVSMNGNTSTLNLAMTFKPTFAGAKNIYMYAADVSGPNSGWQQLGTWTVPSGIITVTANSVTPSSGSVANQSFALQYSDTAGAASLQLAYAYFNSTLASSAGNSCFLYYDVAANQIKLLNDAGAAWMTAAPGAATTLQNAQCSLNVATTTVSMNGNTLTLNLAMTFKPTFAGAKNIYLYGADVSGPNSGWQQLGTWTVPGGITVTANSVTPSSGSVASQTFALQYSDTAGAVSLQTVYAFFNATLASSASNSCFLYYNVAANQINLLNDAGAAWITATPGAAATLQNSQCSLNVATTSVALNGNTLTLNLAMTFKPAYAGAKNAYLYAADISGPNSGWQQLGTWTVPGGITITANSVLPNSGSLANQTFALQYSDTSGAANLQVAYVYFNSTLASSASNSCFVYYNIAANQSNLLNDAGAAWMTATPGAATTLQNSQCSLNVAATSASMNGNTLTLNLAMTFKPAFAGAKNIYMYGADVSGPNSGWQQLGTWTVP
jgi:hypothetical protein